MDIRYTKVPRRLCAAFLCASALSVQVCASDDLSMTVSGHIESMCYLTLEQEAAVTLRNNTLSRVDLDLYCNQPMSLGIQSRNGGIKHDSSNLLSPYSVKVSVPKALINSEIKSPDLQQIHYFDSGQTIPYSAIGQLTFELQEPLIVAGIYRDTVTVSLAPRLILSP
ncbi:hypothetical protein [Vibrio agarivorans]|uniref:hypothetical protein n=1 Tax=Vibrio agarivorans TaxID=153622 RepID=UPI0025B48F5C|nr:hypothetical protein [Vibrio agarivorans]MDN3661384.1 hypothetical protein [Vibrio agarivorans]